MRLSLDIAVWIPDDDSYAGRQVLEDPPDVSTAVGAEAFRRSLWGSAVTRQLGATFLPQLADVTVENRGHLQVFPGQLDAFAQECTLLAENVELLSAGTGYDAERILRYLTTVRDAVRRARAVQGGIIIW